MGWRIDMNIDLVTIGWLEDIIAEQRKKDAIDGQNALDELNQEVVELKAQLVELKAQLAEQVVYSYELQQLVRAGFVQGGKYRDLFKSEREDVFNTLNPSPELLAQHDAEVIDKARGDKGKLNKWSKAYILKSSGEIDE